MQQTWSEYKMSAGEVDAGGAGSKRRIREGLVRSSIVLNESFKIVPLLLLTCLAMLDPRRVGWGAVGVGRCGRGTGRSGGGRTGCSDWSCSATLSLRPCGWRPTEIDENGLALLDRSGCSNRKTAEASRRVIELQCEVFAGWQRSVGLQ